MWNMMRNDEFMTRGRSDEELDFEMKAHQQAVDQREALIAAVRAQVEKERAAKEEKLRRERMEQARFEKTNNKNGSGKPQFRTLSQEEAKKLEERTRRRLAGLSDEDFEEEEESLEFQKKADETTVKLDVDAINAAIDGNNEGWVAQNNNEAGDIPVIPVVQPKQEKKEDDDLFSVIPTKHNTDTEDVKTLYNIEFDDENAANNNQQADEADKKKTEEEKRQAEEAAKRKAEEEKRQAEEAAKRKAEEEKRRAEEEVARRKAIEEAKRQAAEEAKRKAEEEKIRAAEEAKRKAEEERRRAIEEAKRKAEEEKRRAEEAERRKAEEEARRKLAQEARKKAEEAAKRVADAKLALDAAKQAELELKESTEAAAAARAQEIEEQDKKEKEMLKAAEEALVSAKADAKKQEADMKLQVDEKTKITTDKKTNWKKAEEERAKAKEEAAKKAEKAAKLAEEARVALEEAKAAEEQVQVKLAEEERKQEVYEVAKEAEEEIKASFQELKDKLAAEIEQLAQDNEKKKEEVKKQKENRIQAAKEEQENGKKILFEALTRIEEAKLVLKSAMKSEEEARRTVEELAVPEQSSGADMNAGGAVKAMTPEEKQAMIKERMNSPYELPEGAEQYLLKYMSVASINEQIYRAVKTVSENKNEPRNIVILGQHGFGSTVVGEDFARAFYAMGICKSKTIAKIKAVALNRANLKDAMDKLQGGCLIVENAGAIVKEKVEELNRLMNEPGRDVIVILTGEIEALSRLFSENNNITPMFKQMIQIHRITETEILEIAKNYILQLGYECDERGYAKLKNKLLEVESGNLDRVLKFVDTAIENAQSREMKHLGEVVFSNDYENGSFARLMDVDFK